MGGEAPVAGGGAGGQGSVEEPVEVCESGAGGEMSGMRCVCPGEFCVTTANCPWHKRCDEERCEAVAEGTACNGNSECGNAQYCTQGACKNRALVRPGEDCQEAEAAGRTCPEGSECHSMYHPFDPDGAGGASAIDSDCFDPRTNVGFCDSGGPSCKPGYYCPAFWDFEPVPCEQRGALGDDCRPDQALGCLPGLSCNFGKCQPAEAPEGSRCDSRISSGPSSLRRQRLPRNCGDGLYCQSTTAPEGECAPTKALGAACSHWGECSDGYCKQNVEGEPGGTCTALAIDAPCGGNETCPVGASCLSGVCRLHAGLGEACSSERGCPPGSECIRRPNSADVCLRAAAVGEDCSNAFCQSSVMGAAAPICVNVSP
ncbi:MAG: hypothetical protein K0R38_401 [Polyangiaceae bacterium]|jgi:hypothetical protein|nr:hypothetical protein [Polyangiaceae bacterium]